MAEPCTKAFGRYLRILRERRDLSLDDVQSLSQAFADPVSKAYLSRCENGHQLPAVSKLIPLSRIYDVPVEVLTERMELDMELDRIGGPETSGLSYAELQNSGRRAIDEGRSWLAYAFLREAVGRASHDPVFDGPQVFGPQPSDSLMQCATAAFRLDRIQYPLHEYEWLLEGCEPSSRFEAVLQERVSNCYRRLGRFDLARRFADSAIGTAKELAEPALLGLVYSSRGLLASIENDARSASRYYQLAFVSFRKAQRVPDCAISLNNLAQSYFNLGRRTSARRALDAARRIATPLGQKRAIALGRILLAEIETVESNLDRAKGHLSEAVAIARTLEDRVLRFKAEYQLFRVAGLSGDAPAARALERRLRRLAPWIPKDVPELVELSRHAG